jgi:hypothetical protein
MVPHHDQGNPLKQGRRSWKRRTPMFFMDNRGYRGFSYHYKIHRAGKQGIDLFHPKENIPLIFPSTRPPI